VELFSPLLLYVRCRSLARLFVVKVHALELAARLLLRRIGVAWDDSSSLPGVLSLTTALPLHHFTCTQITHIIDHPTARRNEILRPKPTLRTVKPS
jgi:hypothetical protein